MTTLLSYSLLIKWIPHPRLWRNCCELASNGFNHVFKQENQNITFHFPSQYLHPPLRRPSCCAPAPLTWSSSLTPTPSWEMAPLSGKRLSTAPASLRGQRCMESTWSPISCGTWIQTRSTTSACCWRGPGRVGPARPGRLLWAGPSVQVRWHTVQWHMVLLLWHVMVLVYCLLFFSGFFFFLI